METVKLALGSVMIACLVIECILNSREQWVNYERKDTVTNISLAIIGAVVNFLVRIVVMSAFHFLSAFALTDLQINVWYWITLFLLVDLQYYLFHWLGHKSRFFWAMHVIHHSSPKYNFTTALRTPFTNSLFRFVSMTPIVLLGFDSLHILFIDTIILTMSFFQHTEMIRKLGWLEYIFSTPSHHRVHHASDHKYLDKNFGGALILWDKLFGTFQKEEEHPTYGLTKPLKDTGLLNVIVHEWKDICADLQAHRNTWHRLMVVFGKPGWKPKNTLTFSISFLSLPKHLLISIALTLVAISPGMTQPSSHYLAIGIQAEQKHDSDIALRHYETAIRLNPSEAEAYWRASRLYSHRAGRSDNKALKEMYAVKANTLAGHSLMLNPGVVEARLALIISFAMLSEAASSPKEKLKNAYRIREEADVLLKMDSTFAPAYYILGKWHYELSRLNWLERAACDLLFGGMPDGVSIEKSLHYFNKAVILQPYYILFRYGKACTLYEKGDYQATIKVLEETIRLPPSEPDDYLRLKKCEALLKKSIQWI